MNGLRPVTCTFCNSFAAGFSNMSFTVAEFDSAEIEMAEENAR
jgi:hypothetical protein